MKITRAVVPSLFTTLNIFCGFLSIVSTSENQIHLAAWFIILAAIFDSLDGVMARITKSSSQFGVELDSLADVVSFGAAPSFMVYQAYLNTVETWGIIISAMPIVFGAIRLARFNVQLVGFEKDHFKGLPIPLQAITLCAYILQYYGTDTGFNGWTKTGLVLMVIFLSLLMVSRVKYDTLPKISKRQIRANLWKLIPLTLGLLIVIVSKGRLLFLLLFIYVLFGLFRSIVLWMKKIITKPNEEETEEVNELSSIDI